MADPDVGGGGGGCHSDPEIGEGVVSKKIFFLFDVKIRGGGQGPSPGSVSASISSFTYWQLPLGEHTLFSVIFEKRLYSELTPILLFLQFVCFTMTILLP